MTRFPRLVASARSILFVALVVALFAVLVAPAAAQPKAPKRPASKAPASSKPSLALDTVRLAYAMQPGASVTYRVVSRDTLFFHGANAFYQTSERVHHVTYRCDSLTRDGMVLTMSFDGYAAQETRDSIGPVTRTSHPWMDRSYRMLVNPDGRRIRFLPGPDSVSAGVAPSGPFAATPIPYLGEEWTHVGSSELFELNHWLLDNAAPPVLFTGSVFRTVTGRQDTLGLQTIAVSFGETGRATYRADNGSETAAVLNSASVIWFSPLLGLPIAGESEVGARLTLTRPGASEASGRQKIHSTFELVIPEQTNGAAPGGHE